MLTVSIECDEIFPLILFGILSDILESCLESRSGSTVGDMMDEVDRVHLHQVSEECLRPVCRSIIDDEDLGVSCSKNPLNHAHDTSGFVVGSDEENN